MDILSIIQLVVQFAGPVKAIIDEATTNDDILTKVEKLSPSLANVLTGIGLTLFPKAAPTLHLVGGVIASFDPNTTKWLQGSLNVLLTPNPSLVVDGQYGPKTRAAVEQLQTKFGLTVDGLAGQLTQAAIQIALTKLPNLKTA